MGDPRDAHATGTASNPVGTYSSQELVKIIKRIYYRCKTSSVGEILSEAGNKDKHLSTLPSSNSKALDLTRSCVGILLLRGTSVLAIQWLWKLVLTMIFNLQPNPLGRNSHPTQPAPRAAKIPLLRTLKPLSNENTIT